MPTINNTDLNKAAQKYRRELLIMAVIGLGQTLKHMTLRTGIRYKEIVGELDGPVELMPYTGEIKNEGYDEDGFRIGGRSLETFLGQAIKIFDPNKLVSSLYGSAITKGTALKNVPITKAVLTLMMNKISKGLNKSIFAAERKESGRTTQSLFNGFDTITKNEITNEKISEKLNNLYAFDAKITNNNAVDYLKTFYRSASDELKEDYSKLYLPFAVYDAYNDDYQQTVGTTPYNKEFKKTFLEGSDNRCELVPLVGKKDCPYLQLTTKGNMLVGVNQKGEEEKIEVRRGDNPFKLQFVTTMFFGTQYETISPEKLLIGKLYTESEKSTL